MTLAPVGPKGSWLVDGLWNVGLTDIDKVELSSDISDLFSGIG